MISNHPLRTLAASKLFLYGCIIMSIGVLTTTAYSFLAMRPELAQMLNDILNDTTSFSPETLELLQKISGWIVPISIAFGVVFSIALSSIPVVALWLIYFNARSSRSSMKTIGFSILSVYLLISICYLAYNLVLNLIGAIGEESIYSISASSLETLMQLAMLLAARKLVIIAKEIIKTGKTSLPISNQCSVLIFINLCVAAGILLLQIAANVYPNPVGQMREYLFNDLPTMIAGFTASAVSIAEYAVFYVLSRKGTATLADESLPPEENPM